MSIQKIIVKPNPTRLEMEIQLLEKGYTKDKIKALREAEAEEIKATREYEERKAKAEERRAIRDHNKMKFKVKTSNLLVNDSPHNDSPKIGRTPKDSFHFTAEWIVNRMKAKLLIGKTLWTTSTDSRELLQDVKDEADIRKIDIYNKLLLQRKNLAEGAETDEEHEEEDEAEDEAEDEEEEEEEEAAAAAEVEQDEEEEEEVDEKLVYSTELEILQELLFIIHDDISTDFTDPNHQISYNLPHLDQKKLITKGEREFQNKWKAIRRSDLVDTHDKSSMEQCFPSWSEANKILNLNGKPNLQSIYGPLLLELKGRNKNKTLSNDLLDVLDQSLNRLLVLSVVYGFITHACVIAVTGTSSWLVLWRRFPNTENDDNGQVKCHQEFQILRIPELKHFDAISIIWGRIAAMYASKSESFLNKDANFILQTLKCMNIPPLVCLTAIAGCSDKNNIYFVTLPNKTDEKSEIEIQKEKRYL